MKSIEEKIACQLSRFNALSSQERRYEELIKMGQKLPQLSRNFCTQDTLVSGCQSIMHLNATLRDNKVYFEVYSDAFISRGLAAILVEIYSGESPKTILTHAPTFLNDLGILTSLTPGRSNGLMSLHLKMKQCALYLLSTIPA